MFAMIKLFLVELAILLLAYRSTGADQARTANEAYHRFIDVWQEVTNDSVGVLPEYYEYCWRDFLSFEQLPLYADSLIDIAAERLRGNSPPYVRSHAVSILGIQHNEKTYDLLRELIDANDPLCVDAARILIRWGYWDEAASVLEQRGEYESLGSDPRARPILQRSLLHGTSTERFRAALRLSTVFSDSVLLRATARDVLEQIDAEENNAIVYEAFRALYSSIDVTDAMLAGSLVNASSDRNIKVLALGTLVAQARNGNDEAKRQLGLLSRLCADMDIRERASSALLQLSNSQR